MEDRGLNPGRTKGLSLWSLHVLHISVQVFSGYSGFSSWSINMFACVNWENESESERDATKDWLPVQGL